MDYRSYADLTRTLTEGLHHVPADVDLVVAIPRSGIIPATIIALGRNLPITDLDGFLNNRILSGGHTRPFRTMPKSVSECRHALVIDDSIYSGDTLDEVRRKIADARLSLKVTYAAVYATRSSAAKVDLYFDICPFPRMFEWNYMHHHSLGEACVDIDGVLCFDPTEAENDDGPRYREFIRTARPLNLPSRSIHHLVTSRLEKYRPETEEWLAHHGVKYDRLSMIDLPDAETRRRLDAHSWFKGDVYRADSAARIFIESEAWQAPVIAQRAGKPVLCVATRTLFKPGALNPQTVRANASRVRRRMVRLIRSLIPIAAPRHV